MYSVKKKFVVDYLRWAIPTYIFKTKHCFPILTAIVISLD